MAVRSVHYGGGVWRQMEEARVALEQQLAAVTDELGQRTRQLHGATLARDIAVYRISALEQRGSEQERQNADAQRALAAETWSARHFESEAFSWREKSSRLEEARDESEARVEALSASLRAQEMELARAQLEIAEAEQETRRLRDLLYDAQERAELLEQQGARQERALRVLQRATEAKTRQIGVLTKDKHEIARKLAQLRGGGGGCRLAARGERPRSAGDAPSNCPEASSTQPDERAAEHVDAARVVHGNDDEPGAKTTRGTKCLTRMLQRTRELLAQEQQRSAALSDRLRELDLDRRALVLRFREASAARRRAERASPHDSKALSSCA